MPKSRLTRREDGRFAYETKKGVTLVLTAEQLVKRLIALIAPKGLHLTNFHGVFAPAAAARSTLAPPPSDTPRSTPASRGKSAKRPRIDWATLLHRPCGGQRRVVAMVNNRSTAEQMLRNMGMLTVAPPLPQAPGPPQLDLLQ